MQAADLPKEGKRTQNMLLSRNLLYTGLTRAKQLAILVGPTKAIELTVKRIMDRERYTAKEREELGFRSSLSF